MITIRPDRVIKDDLNSIMSQEELSQIKEIANQEWIVLERKQKYASSFSKYFTGKRAEELTYSPKFKNLSRTQRAVLAANIALPDEKMIQIIKGSSLFAFEYLNHYLKLMYYFCSKENKEITATEKNAKNYMDKYTAALMNHFIGYMGAVSPEVIINRINEILSFSPELLDVKNKG